MAVEGKKNVESQKIEKKANFLKEAAVGISNFIKGFKAEVKRITWPSRKEIRKVSVAVLVICSVYVVYIGVADTVFSYLFGLLFNKK